MIVETKTQIQILELELGKPEHREAAQNLLLKKVRQLRGYENDLKRALEAGNNLSVLVGGS